jgi:hypothetical protein
MKKFMIVTAVITVHRKHSAGWVRDHISERLTDFTPVAHLTVEEYQAKEEPNG